MELSAQGQVWATGGMQADYAQLVIGALAVSLAAICYLHDELAGKTRPWRATALFALLQGIVAWAGIFFWSVTPEYKLEVWTRAGGFLSYLLLLRFGMPKRLPLPTAFLFLLQVATAFFPVGSVPILPGDAAPVNWPQVAEAGLFAWLIFAADSAAVRLRMWNRAGSLKLCGGFLALMLLGWLGTGYIDKDTEEELRGYLRARAEIAAVSVRPELIAAFEGFMATGDGPGYAYVNPELQAVQRTSSEIKGLYVVVRRGPDIFFAYSSETEESSGNEAGNRYRRYPDELWQTFSAGHSATAGPYADEWGTFVSAFAPVTSPTGKTIAVLGLDLDAGEWQRTIFRHRLAPISLTLLLFSLGILYVVNRQRLVAAMAKTAASEERFALAMQGANDGLWDWNVATGAVYFSPQWKRMLGVAPDEAETDLRQWAELIHPSERDAVLAELRAYLRGRVDRLECEVRMRHRDGHYIDVLVRAFAVRRGSKDPVPVRVVGTQVDITEKNIAARELQMAKDAAEQSARTRSAFLANMSHEIRTPIHAILGFAQLMRHDENLEPEQQDHLVSIQRNGEYLLGVINEVLEMSKLESARIELHPEEFSLPKALLEVGSLFAGQMKEKGLRYIADGLETLPRYVRADKQKLRQILVNLLGNAVKFTETGQIHVTVSLEPIAQDEGRLIWEVSDSGPGIAAEEQERIFQPFIQAESGVKAGGTGLGLAISREYARLMGGDIWVVSQLNQGSRFRLEIPVHVEHAATSCIVTEEPAAGGEPDPMQKLAVRPEGEATNFDEIVPEGLAAELRDAIRRARIDECEVLLERLRSVCPATTERLKAHLRRFEYGKMLSLLPDETSKPNQGA